LNTEKASVLNVIATLLVLMSALLLVSAFYYPFVNASFELTLPDWIPNWNGIHQRIQSWVVEKGGIIVGPRYLLDIIGEMFRGGEVVLGLLVLGFSVIIPSAKIVMTAGLLINRKLSSSRRALLLKVLGSLARWSMGDVFVVALVIVLFKAEGFHYIFTADIGVYCYAGSTILASLAASAISLANHTRSRRLSENRSRGEGKRI